MSYNFFKLIGLDKIFAICDLDCLFNTNFINFLNVLSADSAFIVDFRKEIGFTVAGQPSRDFINKNINMLDPKKLVNKINELEKLGVFILRSGTPEQYYSENFIKAHSDQNIKKLWEELQLKTDLVNADELESILSTIVKS